MRPNSSVEDRRFYRGLVAGELDALGEVYDRGVTVVCGVAVTVTAGRAAADAVTQEVFVTTANEAQVHDCGLCQLQVAGLRAASGWLGVFVMTTPPQWLRAAILPAGANVQPGPLDRRAGVGDRRVR